MRSAYAIDRVPIAVVDRPGKCLACATATTGLSEAAEGGDGLVTSGDLIQHCRRVEPRRFRPPHAKLNRNEAVTLRRKHTPIQAWPSYDIVIPPCALLMPVRAGPEQCSDIYSGNVLATLVTKPPPLLPLGGGSQKFGDCGTALGRPASQRCRPSPRTSSSHPRPPTARLL